MKEYPIIFSGPMVRAILAGRKTQTRRVCKVRWSCPDHGEDCPDLKPEMMEHSDFKTYGMWTDGGSGYHRSPFGAPGDRLWVRETHAIVPSTAYFHSIEDDGRQVPHRQEPGGFHWCVYRSGWTRCAPRWRSPIHMPRWASRLTLEVKRVRVQRLQEISEEDVVAEGVLGDGLPMTSFRMLWDRLNGKRAPWDSNPWVWVYDFEVVAREEL